MARLLIVDDDLGFQNTVRRMAERLGHEVWTAADGRAALKLFRAHPADVVLMDVYMPDADGIETTLKLSQEFPGVRVVVTTGGGYLSQEITLDLASRLGAFRTLPKPFSVAELSAAIDAALGAAVETPAKGAGGGG
jgi:twitching motility two-component system response regulator PilH